MHCYHECEGVMYRMCTAAGVHMQAFCRVLGPAHKRDVVRPPKHIFTHGTLGPARCCYTLLPHTTLLLYHAAESTTGFSSHNQPCLQSMVTSTHVKSIQDITP